MLHKLRQQLTRHKLNSSNRLPFRRARQFLMNRFRIIRLDHPSAAMRAAMGLVRWSHTRTFHSDERISFRASCFITGRARGTSQRFSISRTRVKQFSSEGRLFGARKSSW